MQLARVMLHTALLTHQAQYYCFKPVATCVGRACFCGKLLYIVNISSFFCNVRHIVSQQTFVPGLLHMFVGCRIACNVCNNWLGLGVCLRADGALPTISLWHVCIFPFSQRILLVVFTACCEHPCQCKEAWHFWASLYAATKCWHGRVVH